MKSKTLRNNYFSGNQKAINVFVILACLHIMYTLVSNICVGKIVALGPFAIAGAFWAFSLGSGCIGDCLVELYGHGNFKVILKSSLVCNILASIIYAIVIALPGINAEASAAFSAVLSCSIYMNIASWIAYYAGNWVDSYSLQWMKKRMKKEGSRFNNDNWLWIRTFGSSILAQLTDTILFHVLGFIVFPMIVAPANVLPWSTVLLMMPTGWFLKLLVELIFQPIEVVVFKKLKKYTGMDVIDVEGENINLATTIA